MKPKELSRKSPEHVSFSISKHQLPRFLNVWHYHDEIELVYTQKSSGTKFIGDSISTFKPGDLVLIGSRLPHMWLNDQDYFDRNDLSAEAIVVHFHPACLGDSFFKLPELKKIHQMMQEALIGLEINGDNKTKITQALTQLSNADECEKIIDFLKILNWIAEDSDKRKLSTSSFMNTYGKTKNSKLDVVYEYIFNNFKGNIGLNDVAELACMNPSSFSRYFKQMTNKTFKNFLNEVRIGFACKLILEHDNLNIAQIGFECGYNNLSNFNKQFKHIMKITPTEYYLAHTTGTPKSGMLS